MRTPSSLGKVAVLAAALALPACEESHQESNSKLHREHPIARLKRQEQYKREQYKKILGLEAKPSKAHEEDSQEW